MSVENTPTTDKNTSGSKRFWADIKRANSTTEVSLHEERDREVSSAGSTGGSTEEVEAGTKRVRKNSTALSSTAKEYWKDTVSEERKGLPGFRMNLALAMNDVRYKLGGNSICPKNDDNFTKQMFQAYIGFVKENRDMINRGDSILLEAKSPSSWFVAMLNYTLLGYYLHGVKIMDTNDIAGAYRTGDIYGLVNTPSVVIMNLGVGNAPVASKQGALLLSIISEVLSYRRGKLTVLATNYSHSMNLDVLVEAKKQNPQVIIKEW